ncbi:GAF domain-containing protein [Bradyrhizobium sp. LjRoot220]|uniref:bifunctional diguanylate cyclase/phosphodiesterase n=1 Tax=Bradyrhizobium sp. LjRoot220 TaxID=3342284 RepID=UPI003ECEC0F8
MKTSIARTFAALNATNEAILYAKSPEELYAKVCEAAFSVGDFLAVAVFLLEPETNLLRFAAGCGDDVPRLRSIDISVVAGTPEGSGVAGQAFRDGRICVSNDFLNEPRSLAWREGAKANQVGAAAALPLTCNGESVGVLLVSRREAHSIDGQLVSMLERVSANISFALDNFDHEAARKNGERTMRRLNRMFGAISATNEAILRAKTEQELYQRVCDAAVYSGKSIATVVLLSEPGSIWLKPAAGAGESLDPLTRTRFSIDADNQYGKGVAGQAFRTQRPCIDHDIVQGGPWQQPGREAGVVASVAVPLIKAGQSAGVVIFFVGKAWAADEEIIALLARIAENVSFALDNFERAAAKAKADEQKDRLTRMFAALSATNEAIMRARSRTEMFDLVCAAAAQGGRFNSTSILLVGPDSDFFNLVAAAGPTADNARRLKVSISEAVPEGRGVCGTAFRSRQACINNDFLAGPRNDAFDHVIKHDGARSGAAFPLVVDDRIVGVMLFISSQPETFTAEFAELLQRLADNVSFALESFDRADAKANTEQQKERLTRMFAALGATNEAIMRAKSRTELFELVCEAATVGGNFTSTAIVLERPGAEFLENVASAGPDRTRAGRVKLSTDAGRPEGQGITGTAFRSGQPCISNDYLGEFGATAHFYKVVRDSGTRSGAALPLLKNGKAIGVIVFLSSELGAFSPELIALLRRLAENISFALDNFDRADEKAKSEHQKDSLTRMLAALSATNEAIVRAGSRDELYQLVCEAAATGGGFTSTTIALAKTGSDFMEIVAGAGPTGQSARQVTLSVSEAEPTGRGVCGITFRTGQACIFNDYLADPRAVAFHEKARRDGSRSGAGFPLFVRGRVVGVMLYVSLEKDAFTPEFAELLQRLADNVSFALETFERADEKARMEAQKESLTRMLAALSATNEAIVRATTRGELFELVCQATADGGKFTATTIALTRPDSDYLEIVATAGPTADSAREVRMSVNEAHPEGQGCTGVAIRSGRACFINDYLADPRSRAFHVRARRDSAKAGASFPLIVRGRVVGVLILIAIERNTFTPEFSELLQRLTDNVSFALENFDRADEKTRADERIEYLASHDSLTKLPNREMFNGLLRRAIDAAERYRRSFAVLFIDLDRFKVINDSLGHDAGDMLLVEIGGRLRNALRSSDVVARLGGDEFVVILEEAAERHEVERIAGELLSVLGQPLQLSGHECHTTASIGIAMYPSDGADMQTLTKNADMAMYLAKEDGKNGFRFFTREIKVQSIERLTLESALRRALERDQFSLHYQPKVDMASGQITGVEALLRWNHPELGLVSPGQFIPLAEETGLIVPIGRWVLTEACAQNMAWQRRGLRPVTMAVNLSPRQFADDNLLHDVDEALLASGMSPVLLQLEVTESMVMRNVTRAIKVLDAVQSRGIRLAIDDFGTGYSSMSLMKQFPIDTIKIDRSFVRDLPNDSEDQAIAQAIISMGKALGMTVIAEGVETIEQQTFLRNHACDEMQGFLFSKPLPPRQMADMLRSEPQLASPPLQPEAGDAGESASPSRLKSTVV